MEFSYTIHGDPAQKLEIIKQKAAEKFVQFNGNLTGGTFSGGVSLPVLGDQTILGSYVISGYTITVNVTKKPASYSWEKVDSLLRGFIEG